jgi:HlyD family secretion protein
VWRTLAHSREETAWQGYAEADFVMVAPTQQGQLTALRVARGDHVDTGTPLFDQDDTLERATRDQAQRQRDQAEQELANLVAPSRPNEIKQAEANLADAIASRDRLRLDADRYEKLLPTGSVSIQARDQSRADYLSAEAKVEAEEAALAQSRSPTGRADEIKAQQAAVASARAAVAMAAWHLDQRHVLAPKAGVVADTMARAGETLAAGAAVVSLLPPENIFIRFFVPEGMLPRIHRGDRVSFTCDNGRPGLTGTIDFIAPQAEYTPPVIYSEESRAKLVFMVQARPPPDQATLFNPGQPVVVRPLAQPTAQQTAQDHPP